MASIVDHIRRSYRPPTAVLEPEPGGWGFTGEPATPDARTVDGLIVYRFAASLYYANAEWFGEEVLQFVQHDDDDAVRWICLDLSALPDVDFPGSETLKQLHAALQEHNVRLVTGGLADPASRPSARCSPRRCGATRAELDRFGITELVGADAYYDSVGDAVAAFRAAPAGEPVGGTLPPPSTQEKQ